MKIPLENPRLEEALITICSVVQAAGGSSLVVGGCVRDSILGKPLQDLDVEVYGIMPADLKKLLGSHFQIDLVGEAFGVIKIHGLPIDISIPRRESKSGMGHKGFDILSDPSLTIDEAASRRDFTINSMAFDPLSGQLYDYFGGQNDLRHRVLRHTSQKFTEDPLRVLRGMQFAARFHLSADPETIGLCRTMESEGLARERIFEEWTKLILQGERPSCGLGFLKETEWIRYFPELQALVGCPQDPVWHPEGDVWIHTTSCMDAFAEERTGDKHEDLVVGLAVLCHDFGKPMTTKHESGRTRSIGHSEQGKSPTQSFLSRMTNQRDLIDEVVPLVVDHLRPVELHNGNASNAAIRRLACRVGRIDRLVRVARADQRGRLPAECDGFPAGDWLLNRAHELEVRDSAPKPIVMGRHLLELGLETGPAFGPILGSCYEAQIEGRISNLAEGIAFAGKLIDQ